MASLLFFSSKHSSRGLCLLSSQFAKRSLQPRARFHHKGGQLLLCSRCFNSNNGSRKLAAISQRTFEGVKYFRTSSIFYEEQVVNVPPFADSISEGDLRWEKNVGDEVATDEVVCEVETDKTSVPVPSPGNGVIIERYVEDGASVKAGQKLFKINITGAAPSKAAAPKAEAAAAAAPPPPKAETAAPPPQAATPATPPPPPPAAAAAPPSAAKPIPVAAIRHAQVNIHENNSTLARWKRMQIDLSLYDRREFKVESCRRVVGRSHYRVAISEEMQAVITRILENPQLPITKVMYEAWPKSRESPTLYRDRLGRILRLQFAIEHLDKPMEFWNRTVWCSRKNFHYDGAKKIWKSRSWSRLPFESKKPETKTDEEDAVWDHTVGFWISVYHGGIVALVPSFQHSSLEYRKILEEAIEAATVKVPPVDYSKEISGTRSEQRVKMNRMRLRIAQRLKDAQNTNAMLTTFNELDMSAIMDFRKTHLEAFTKKYGIKLGFMSAFVKAAAYALQDQPVVNAVIEENEIVYRDYVDISVAVATPKGLVVPVIRNVESMNYADIELTINALGEKARKGALAIEDMDGGTFTISNGGVFGSVFGTPIINPPQSAILGMHGTFERPVAIKGQVVVRPMMYIALTYDHRLIDGREAVLFLRKIKAAVEDPRIILAGL